MSNGRNPGRYEASFWGSLIRTLIHGEVVS